eukprot:scaffold1004_cov269-Pinguiococcus_pyrenoidosus.AAC.12
MQQPHFSVGIADVKTNRDLLYGRREASSLSRSGCFAFTRLRLHVILYLPLTVATDHTSRVREGPHVRQELLILPLG